MERKEAKEAISQRLRELTQETQDPSKYFSPNIIFEYLREKVRGDGGFAWIAGFGGRFRGASDSTRTTVDVTDRMPVKKDVRSILEELAKEGRAESITLRTGRDYPQKEYVQEYKGYRAI